MFDDFEYVRAELWHTAGDIWWFYYVHNRILKIVGVAKAYQNPSFETCREVSFNLLLFPANLPCQNNNDLLKIEQIHVKLDENYLIANFV